MNATLATHFPVPRQKTCGAGATVRSAEELRALLRNAGTRQAKGHLAQLDRVLRLDSRNRLVEVQAGARWEALSTYLDSQKIAGASGLDAAARGFAVPATAGECVAHNPACPDGTPFAIHVAALAVVSADGELRRTSRLQQPELFQRVVGGHGMMATVYSVTLSIDSLVNAFTAASPPVTLDAQCEAGPVGESMRLMVPPANLQAFLAELRQALDDFRLPVCALSVRKALPDTETRLRWATGELALIDLRFPARPTLPARVAATQVRRALIAAALAHGGRFDLATGCDASREQVEAAYPMLKSLLAEKRRCDPQERLGGAFYAHFRALFQRGSCEVRWAAQ